MKYYTKIEWVLNHDDFMKSSTLIQKQIDAQVKRTGKPIKSKDIWKLVNVQINKKRKNHTWLGGICACKSGELCDHRKKYLIAVLYEE